MIYNYKALESSGIKREGSIDAVSLDVAVDSLQKRGLIIAQITPAEKTSWFSFNFHKKVSNKDVVILSRQMATLFDAQVSALKIFALLSVEMENKTLQQAMVEISDDLKGGSSISKALEKHPKIFSSFYVNMVRSGEETGKLNETFSYLADYLDRNFEVVSKAKNALIYPAFVVGVFVAVMLLMLTFIIPKISGILISSGQPVPGYTQFIFNLSDFFLAYGWLVAIIFVVVIFLSVRYIRTPSGKRAWARLQLQLPVVGSLYNKLYLSLLTDNINTMITSGIPMVRAIEVTAAVVGNQVYREILEESLVAVRSGAPFSDSLSHYKEIPGILVQMIKIGEETGETGSILKTMAKFYQREVVNAVDTMVALIEPIMIVFLGVAVGILLASVLLPIYNIALSTAS